MRDTPINPGQVKTGDVLLYRRGRTLMSWLIAGIGRSPYSHAAMIDRVGDSPLMLETRQWIGARVLSLRDEVLHGDTPIDVYRPVGSAAMAARQAAAYMWRLEGREYGWLALFRAALLRMPVLRLVLPAKWKQERGDLAPYCSMAVSAAYRSAGVDLVPNLADQFTEPGDLARSAMLQYVGTLSK
jgi:hypothetical protein